MNIHQNAANNAKAQGMDQISDRRLWAAVLLQALEDWKSSNLRRKREAEKFFFEGGADFTRVCTGAGLTPESVLGRLRQMKDTVRSAAQPLSHPVSELALAA
jgi:hypothetical protein